MFDVHLKNVIKWPENACSCQAENGIPFIFISHKVHKERGKRGDIKIPLESLYPCHTVMSSSILVSNETKWFADLSIESTLPCFLFFLPFDPS